MRKKTSSSLSRKVFLWVFVALSVCSMLIYGMVLVVVPSRYQVVSDSQLEQNTRIFIAQLGTKTYDEAEKEIYNFCIENNSAAVLTNGGKSAAFGDVKFDKIDSSATYASSVILDNVDYMLTIISVSKTANELLVLLLKLIPLIIFVVVLLSILSAFICSKVITTPILKISQISKRMTELDMTWRCDTNRRDEIGLLSENLNTMASRLEKTMMELETANQQLTADVSKFQKMEEQRRNFFTAVSHELKTPLTILKGQLENMIMGYGDYRNHEKYLPQTLKATEDIEYLVREILSITKMEAMNVSETLENTSLWNLLSHLIDDMESLAKEKKITVFQDTSLDVDVLINTNLFRKALSNIIGNAIRHSEVGAEVYVLLKEEKHIHTLVVENTGAHISDDDLGFMFTPFYRADKSRSKATGGSGLGLYIIKTILDLHNMGYRIENTDRGVSFYLQLNHE